jgi:hypothetical protein
MVRRSSLGWLRFSELWSDKAVPFGFVLVRLVRFGQVCRSRCGRVRRGFVWSVTVRLGAAGRFRCGWVRYGLVRSVKLWLGAARRSSYGVSGAFCSGMFRQVEAVKLKGVKLWLDLKRKIDRE